LFTNNSKLLAYLEICRPHVALQAAAFTLLGAFLSGGIPFFIHPQILTSAIMIALAVAFAFVVNDYKDVNVDSINKPDHPIPSGRVSKTEAFWIAIVTAIIVLLLSLFMGSNFFMIALYLLSLSASYSIVLKGTPLIGNFAVAILSASIILIGAIAANGVTRSAWIVSVFVLIYTLAQEVLYTIRDHDADKNVGLCTTAVSFGIENCLWVYRISVIIFVFIVIIPWVFNYASSIYLLAVIVLSITPLMVNIIILRPKYLDQNINLACKITKVARMTSLVVAILLK